MNWLTLTILTLTCYRLARLIAIDAGPADIFLLTRAILGAYRYGPNGRPVTNLGRGVSCPHCVGVWIAAGLAIAFYPLDWWLPIYWLAIAGGQSFLWSMTNGSE